MKRSRLILFNGKPHPVSRVIATLLIPVHLFTALPVPVMAVVANPAVAPQTKLEPPAEAFFEPLNAPNPVKRPVPVFAPPARELTFSVAPSDSELIQTRVFEEPLVPIAGKASGTENSDLARAVLAFSHATQNLAPLTEYLDTHPDSRWKASLLTNLGLLYRSQGYWSKALEAWEASWPSCKAGTDPLLKTVADRTFGELTQLHARLGHFDRLETLFKEIDQRDVQGAGTERVAGARAGLWLMKNEPGEAFRCGPLAISKLFQVLHPNETVPATIGEMKSTQQGTCLADLLALATKVGLEYQIAFREPGAPILYPSLIHWKVGHYAALTKPMADGYLTQDLTFGTDTILTVEALDAEASGYFLVPAGTLPKGWRTVQDAEAKTIFGKGNAGPGGTTPPPCNSITTNSCVKCSPGMASYNLEMTSISLMLMDTPVGYAPPVGPAIQFTANYNHRESAAMTTISNLGSKWSFGWLSYIMAPSDANTVGFGPGGGQLAYTGFNGTTGNFSPQLLSQDRLVKVSPNNYVRYHSDGSSEIFDLAETGANPRIFRTRSIDSMGNAISFGYDANYRLRTVTDAIGQVTVIDYELTNDPISLDFYKITRVTDPFGRFATFQYNGIGQLWKITDTLGLVSAFVYGQGDFVTSLTTPYGTTSFTGSDSSYNRWLEVTDPLGGRERVEWVRDSSWIPSSDPSAVVPTGFVNGLLNYRNTYYWDKKAMADAPGDYAKARITHWEHVASDFSQITPIIESTKAPLENRVWRAYAGQAQTYAAGPTNQPSRIARILDDGTEQDFQYEYNAQGNVTKSTDPLGRETDYEYDTNGIDVLRIKQKNGAAYDLLSSFTYNAMHEPLTATDASGQTTNYTYNGVGQPLTVTNAKNETTTFEYGTVAGQLDYARVKTITGPVTGATTSFTYDNIGRVRTVTDSQNYTVTTDYDVFDRPSKITYPDSTYEQVLYNRLDPEWTRDRLGRWSHQLYDSLRHLAQQIDPLNRKTTYEWCLCGSLTGLVDPAGNRTSWLRDVQSRVIKKIYPDLSFDSYTYENTTSRLKILTDAKNQNTNYQYFLDDSLQQTSYTNAQNATPTVNFTYDPFYLRVATMTDGVGVTNFNYNPVPAIVVPAVTGAGRLANIDGPLANDTIAYTYDELGRNLTRSINGVANNSSLHFDALGRIDQTSNALGTFALAYVGVTGRIDHIDYPNSQKIAYDYFDNLGDQRLKQIKNLGVGATPPVISQFDYTYDVTGEIKTWTQSYQGAPNAQRYELRYDFASQLVGALLKNASTNAILKDYGYGYDLAGNRTREQIDTSVNTSGYNSLNQLTGQSPGGPMEFSGTVNEPATVTLAGQPVSVDSANNWRGQATVTSGTNNIPLVATDVNGNVTTKTIQVTTTGGAARTLSYDLDGAMTDDGAGKTYSYNALNQLVKITQSANVTEFVYNGAGQRVQEKLNGTVIKQWIWCGGAQPCEERDAANNVTKRFFAQGEQIGGANYFYVLDHLGSVREMTDAMGAVRARYDYDPYGRITKVSGDLEADFGFTGFYRHQASGLNLTVTRAYDANLGRWLSRDTIGERGGINLYGYVRNNPINRIDPDGRNPAAGAILGGEIGTAVFPGVGTAIGIGVGALVGLLVVGWAIDKVNNAPPAGGEWAPRTRDKQPDKMGGEDSPIAKGRPVTPEQAEKIQREAERRKGKCGRGGRDNLPPDEIDEILDEVLGE